MEVSNYTIIPDEFRAVFTVNKNFDTSKQETVKYALKEGSLYRAGIEEINTFKEIISSLNTVKDLIVLVKYINLEDDEKRNADDLYEVHFHGMPYSKYVIK